MWWWLTPCIVAVYIVMVGFTGAFLAPEQQPQAWLWWVVWLKAAGVAIAKRLNKEPDKDC